jgi:hypothetical protein
VVFEPTLLSPSHLPTQRSREFCNQMAAAKSIGLPLFSNFQPQVFSLILPSAAYCYGIIHGEDDSEVGTPFYSSLIHR